MPCGLPNSSVTSYEASYEEKLRRISFFGKRFLVGFSHFGRRRTPGIRDSRLNFVQLDHFGEKGKRGQKEKGVRNLFWPLLDHRRFGFTVFPYLLALPAGLTGKGS